MIDLKFSEIDRLIVFKNMLLFCFNKILVYSTFHPLSPFLKMICITHVIHNARETQGTNPMEKIKFITLKIKNYRSFIHSFIHSLTMVIISKQTPNEQW